MLKGRLGLEKARIPHADRHGLLWLSRGELCVIDGCLHFVRGKDSLTPGIDQIPHQAVSMILLGPGSSVTQDALRLLARHGTLLAAVGEDGVRSYTAPPLLPGPSRIMETAWCGIWSMPGVRLSLPRRKCRQPSITHSSPRESHSRPWRSAWGMRAFSSPRRPLSMTVSPRAAVATCQSRKPGGALRRVPAGVQKPLGRSRAGGL